MAFWTTQPSEDDSFWRKKVSDLEETVSRLEQRVFVLEQGIPVGPPVQADRSGRGCDSRPHISYKMAILSIMKHNNAEFVYNKSSFTIEEKE